MAAVIPTAKPDLRRIVQWVAEQATVRRPLPDAAPDMPPRATSPAPGMA